MASLMTVKQGLVHWLRKEFALSRQPAPAYAGTGGLPDAEFAVELDRERPGETAAERVDGETAGEPSPHGRPRDWLMRGHQLIARLEALIAATDFRQLYDHKSKLFVLGYHAASGERDGILYDLLASEARQTSFVAIALGQISVAHWLALGRTVKKHGNYTTPLSWSGTMFEFMMPWLIMRTYPNTIWDSTYRGVVQRQIEYARERGVPFGISESGYYAYDYQLNYQYRAFGVPGLGFKRGLEQDLVLAPYATVMALPYALREGLHDLRRMGSSGRGGVRLLRSHRLYAGTYAGGRVVQGDPRFMAHHQGMSLLTLANLLLPDKMYDYFHRDKRVQAAELLLQERIPAGDSIKNREIPVRTRTQKPKPAHIAPLQEYDTADTPVPEVNVHSNGTLTTVITGGGSGFIRFKDLAVSRWREDPVADPWGDYMYIRDVHRDRLWSPAYQPCRAPADRLRVQFSQERTTFLREDGELQTTLEIAVSPDANAELRRLTIVNTGGEARSIEVTTFLEIALASPDADKAHPAFTKLFVETQYEAGAECLLARKRPRNAGEPSVWAFHTLSAGGRSNGPAEFETDRARFIGRGYTLARPRGVDLRLEGTVGSVADPAFVMRRRLTVEPGGQIQLTAVTGIAESKEQALELAQRSPWNSRSSGRFSWPGRGARSSCSICISRLRIWAFFSRLQDERCLILRCGRNASRALPPIRRDNRASGRTASPGTGLSSWSGLPIRRICLSSGRCSPAMNICAITGCMSIWSS
ncbi:hypothetical protein LJK88_42950 [Paenibacillus sp. P26]|nr:hypothetical protein LJK88_42950 [Paenibacillus sp. P26]